MTSTGQVALAVCLALLTGVSCAGEQAGASTSETPPELVLEGIAYRYYEGSTLVVSGTARTATFRNATGAVTADELFAHLHDEARGSVEARARRVNGNLLLKWADAESGVQMLDINGTSAMTERASFDARKQRFFGETPVNVHGEGFQATASSGFSLAIQGDRVLHFQGPIASQFLAP
ncbi:MAG: hypothetical protein IKC51_04455 [Myxococcaceae bacterium]|nr:hypothetical protein [Myxococcaceae bacterium]